MRTFHSYEDLASAQPTGYLPEAYTGTAIVQWYGNIERQLTRMLEENEASRNFVYADKLRQFIKTWRENEVSGSLNRDTLVILKTATEQLSVDSWNLANYFSNLRDQLRKLLASEEQLPRGGDELDDKMGGPGGGAGGGSLPPMSPEFGPEKNMPGGMPGPAGEGDVPPEGEMPGPEEIGPDGKPIKKPGEEDELENANAEPPPRANA
ncbi:MAG: hypothetical protein ACOYB3_00165 [Azonexus sp.]